MAAAVPLLETIISATDTQIKAITSPVNLSSLVDQELPRFPSRWEKLKGSLNTTTGQLDYVFIDCESVTGQEGPAAGERYSIYNFVIYYYGLRLNDANWHQKCQRVAQSIVAKIDGNTSIFQSSSQRQLFTPETADVRSQGIIDMLDEQGRDFKIFEAQITFQVEARRWP